MSCTTIIRCALLLGALTTAGLAHAEGRPQEFTWFNLPSDLKSASAPQSARRHVDQLSGVVAEDNLELVQTDTLLGGAALVRFQPRIDGIPVFHEEIALLLDRHHTLVAMRGPLPESLPVSGKALPAFRVDAREAIALALADWHPSMRAMPDLGISMRGGEYERFHADPDGACDNPSDLVLQRARRVWYRTGTGLQPAWYVETQACLAGQSRTGRAHVVSASDRAVLFRKDLNAHATAFEYRVWAEPPPAGLPLPSPRGRAAMPDPDGLPTDNLGAFVPQSSRTLANIPFSRAASDGWLAPGATLTSGNNVSAYTDRVEPDGLSPGDVYPSLTGPLQFNYAFDVNADPASSVTQSSAVVVQMFYILNWLHDWIYDSGFTEADGNAQLDNFGRGGLGGDGIIAEAQDFATDDNARMFTPADGASPRMRVGLATRLVPVGDFALDFRVLAHEWAHHLSSRLIGDASGLGPEHAQGLGEGWSDFVGQLALVKAEDRLKPGNASFEGAYSGPAFHSYYGFRRYPFSTDLSKNPLTLRFVEDGVPLPAGPTPAFGADGADNSQVHRQGEIWAVALWECYASLLNDTQRLSFDEAQARMKAYLVAGMKLTPVAPTMTEARDALLAVVLAGGQMEDYRLFAAAFAKRGFGAGADIPDRYSTSMSGVRESFAQGAHLRLEQFSLSGFAGCDSDSVLDNGETALLAMVAKNTGFERLSGATVRFSANHPGLRFPQGAERTLGPIERNSSQILSLPIELEADLDPNTPITITASPLVLGDNATATQATHVEFVNFDEVPASSMVEDFEGTHLPWEVQRDLSGDGEATWKLRTEATTKFLHGEDTAFSAVIYAITPSLSIGSEPLVLTLRHRYDFEYGNSNGRAYDGGLLQVSKDDGQSWSGIDSSVLGSVQPLSDCCGNPMAGKPAFFAKSTEFPEFFIQTINFGTTYAGTAKLRFRFAIATDESITGSGWDIDSLGVSGATNTPFTDIVRSACASLAGRPLQGAMSGTYYTSTRSGEGVMVDIGLVASRPTVLLGWYTYDAGEQRWLFGTQQFDKGQTQVTIPLVQTEGASFGMAFKPQDVTSIPWGSVALRFDDCDSMTLIYDKTGGEKGTLQLQRGLARLSPNQCNQLPQGLSGTFYSPDRPGEGVMIGFGLAGNTPTEVFGWYTYEAGKQAWLFGTRPWTGAKGPLDIDLIRTEGANFGSGFRPEDVRILPWGKVTQFFQGCNTLRLDYAKTAGDSGTLLLERGLERLDEGVCE